eukprot:m.264171 g.264171  ORF g.264171 m.264171 type:complete len:162 (+) comp54656_c0_seq2:3-488(+)
MKGFFAIANLLFTFGDCHDWAKLSILCAYYRSAVGVLIVYDITKRTTYDHVKLWLQEVQAHTAEDTVVMLVGNKCDLRHLRAVSTEEARKLAAENGMSFIETSALDATNVSQAINQIMFDMFCIETLLFARCRRVPYSFFLLLLVLQSRHPSKTRCARARL